MQWYICADKRVADKCSGAVDAVGNRLLRAFGGRPAALYE
jgi:hypothetical protein